MANINNQYNIMFQIVLAVVSLVSIVGLVFLTQSIFLNSKLDGTNLTVSNVSATTLTASKATLVILWVNVVLTGVSAIVAAGKR